MDAGYRRHTHPLRLSKIGAPSPTPEPPEPPKPPPPRASYRTLKDAAQAAANATFRYSGKVQRFGTAGGKALTKDELVKWYLAHWRRHPRSKPK